MIYKPNYTIQIVSPSTEHKDRTAKFSLYEQQGVKNYLIVNPSTKQLDAFSLESDKYQHIVCEENWTFPGPSNEVSIRVCDLFE